jgi:catechol 2,3-dioxygenase-like lactoylglutathione lyase family enzyme
MKTIDKLIMFHMGVSDMDKSKKFYADTMGFEVTKDYGQGDRHWVSLDLPGGGTSLNLTTALENLKPGTMKLYLSTPDIQAAYRQLTAKGVKPTSQIADDLYGPGSGVKWFSLDDPDGNQLFIVQSLSV